MGAGTASFIRLPDLVNTQAALSDPALGAALHREHLVLDGLEARLDVKVPAQVLPDAPVLAGLPGHTAHARLARSDASIPAHQMPHGRHDSQCPAVCTGRQRCLAMTTGRPAMSDDDHYEASISAHQALP